MITAVTMKNLAKIMIIPIVCIFALAASISPLSLHTFVETVTGPIGEFWTDHHHSDHPTTNHRHSTDSNESDPEHESSKILAFHSGSNSISKQVLLPISALRTSWDRLCAEERNLSSSILLIRIDTSPPTSAILSILSRCCPETAPPSFV
jgi:hypothetical protein